MQFQIPKKQQESIALIYTGKIFFLIYSLIGGKLLYKVVLVSVIQQCTLNFLFHDPLNVFLFVFQVTEFHVILFWLVAGF